MQKYAIIYFDLNLLPKGHADCIEFMTMAPWASIIINRPAALICSQNHVWLQLNDARYE